jgi:hypothetical protein
VNIQGRIGRSVPFLENSAHGHTSILCRDGERTFDNVGRQPSVNKRAKRLIVRLNDAGEGIRLPLCTSKRQGRLAS